MRVDIDAAHVRAVARRSIWRSQAAPMQVAIQAASDIGSAIAQCFSDGLAPGTPVVVVMDEALVQQRRLAGLPAVSGRALRSIVAANPARFFRPRPSGVITDVRWRKQSRNTDREAHAIAADRVLVDEIVAAVDGLGGRVDQLRVLSDDTEFDLLPAAQRQARNHVIRERAARSVVGTLLLLLVVASAVFVAVARREGAARRQVEALRALAASVDRGRRAMWEAERMAAAVPRERHATLALLSEVTAGLNDSSFLTGLTVREGGYVEATGLAQRAAAVAGALEKRKVLEGVKLEVAGIREAVLPGVEWDRFTIHAGSERQ